MRGLISLINELTSTELLYLKRSLTKEQNHKLNTKTYKLLQLILAHGNNKFNKEFYGIELHNAYNKSLFNRLIKRLLEKCVDALIHAGADSKKDSFRENTRHFILTRKFLLAVNILHKRLGNREVLRYLEIETEKLAKRDDLVVELAEISLRRAKTEGFLSGIREFYRFTNIRQKHLLEIELSDKIQRYYYELILNPKYTNSYNRDATKIFLESVFKEISQYKTVIKNLNPHDEYLLLYLKIEYGIISGNIKLAIQSVGKQLKLYYSIPSMRIPGKLTALYANLGYIYITSSDYDGASKYLNKALKISVSNNNANIINQDIAFLNQFYAGKYEEAEKHLKHCLQAPESHGSFRISKYRYHQACLHFVRKDFKKASLGFSQKMDFASDRMGYGIWTRIMQVLCLIEMKDLLAASSKTKVLERQYERLKHLENFPSRTALIIRILLSLEKTDFRKEKLKPRAKELLRSLREKKKPHSWEHFTPELIKFHDWIAGSSS